MYKRSTVGYIKSNKKATTTRYQGMAYRLLAFWDKDMKALVIATHGFIKKKQKTPSNEIKRAEDLMKKYYER
ncbi:MAG: type II toxin-antitoxin system RelE/ParE family toxin [Bacteroidales bacterium]|nr:type II toxin-antitoxin system RelE/ParE family toxin [Bacteroidales bacterium]